jgi:photosystem II stability/assembly factor-like uncharacterized protein
LRTIFPAFWLILLTSFAHTQSGWVAQEAITRGDLVAVFFTSSDKGWVAGDGGFLAKTTDGGRTWDKVPLNTTEDINEIYFRNDDNGYLVAGRKMFITRDAGRTWKETRIYRAGDFGTGTPEFLSIRFSDKKRGYAIGSLLRRSRGEDIVVDSLLMRTEDGGETWRRISVPTKAELFHLDFSGNSHGWIVGDGGVILASTDEGRTWSKQSSGTTMPLYNVDFRDDKEGYVVGKSGTILRTSNGGSTWERVTAGFRDTLMRVDFADDKNGWIVGYGGKILRSNDKGRTWIAQDSGTRERLYGLFMDKKFGWAVGAKGVVLRYRK